jgi:ribonuclease III
MNLKEFIKKLDILLVDYALVEQAFVHRSYLNETKKQCASNERLEFLGDSILSYFVSDYLYKQYPNLPEGELTNIRSSLVKTATLASVAEQLKLGKFLLLSKGEEESGGRNNPSLLADTFEAFLGAVYLSSDLIQARKILVTYLFPKLTKIMQNQTYKDAKSTFQEVVQEELKASPLYKVIKEIGPDHAKQFSVGVYVHDTLWGEGNGRSKQEAEQAAATLALEKWQKK